MRNRLSKCSKQVAFAACMLALGGSFSACQDEYLLDEMKPTWLNSSIYETLESNGNYKNYLRLIADPDVNSGESEESSLVQILSRTGSKTVFVANDQAWQKFFDSNGTLSAMNPWKNVRSYEDLSKSQKKLLLHTSMLNNAIVMENLASNSGTKPTRGEYLRRFTDVEMLDTITRICVKDLPKSFWSADKQASETEAKKVERDQWSRIRSSYKPEDSIYIVMDNTLSMMIHFTNEYMTKKQITPEDFKIIMGRERSTDDVHIYNALLDSADIVCENGYVNMTEKPLVPLSNMAEIIRTNGKTNIFSHMLDRFSVPYEYNSIEKAYAVINPNFNEQRDTIYSKRYFSSRSIGGNPLNVDDEIKKEFTTVLKYDPGWNGYFPNASAPEEDMGAMFVPNDKYMIDYFQTGGGQTLLQEYTKDRASSYDINNLETLYQDIDQIPLDKIFKIVDHCMFASFVNSVPSKMIRLREESTLEQIFREEQTQKGPNGIDTVLLACNGAVYIMNNVSTPSDFDCVATPAYIRSTNRVMWWAIYSDYLKAQANKQDDPPLIGLNYFAYLKAMQSNFSFFMPSDEGMKYYYDPMSFTSKQPRLMRFLYDPSVNTKFPFVTKYSSSNSALMRYNVQEGKITGQLNKDVAQEEMIGRFRNMLEDFTIVHNNKEFDINEDNDEYYTAKNGMGIKVHRRKETVETPAGPKEQNRVYKVQGGFQIENERENIPHNHNGIQYCSVDAVGDYKNGFTFTLDAPVIPAARSVFSVLSNIKRGQTGTVDQYNNPETQEANPYLEFFRLCNGHSDDETLEIDIYELVQKSGLVDVEDYESWDVAGSQGNKAMQKAIDKYYTFYATKDEKVYGSSGKAFAVDQNVFFFNNFRYTVFAPSNSAIQKAIANGLPTWKNIQEDFNDHIDENGELKTQKDSLRIQNKIVYLTNFIRSHFADDSFFADNSDKEASMTTSSFNNDTKLYVKVSAERITNGEGKRSIRVKDSTKNGKWAETINTWVNEDDVRNVMTCDRVCAAEIKNRELTKNHITTAISFAVVHLIDGVLNHQDLTPDGKYPDFDNLSSSEARKYIDKFAIR